MGKNRIFVDVSGLVNYDPKTGISRVVKSQLKELVKIPKSKMIVKTIYLKKQNNIISHYYCKQTLDFKIEKEDKIAFLKKSDILYNPDLSYEHINLASKTTLYKNYKALGVKIIFLIHDMLPIQYPNFFVNGTKQKHENYIKNICNISDLIITTTNTTKNILKKHCIYNKLNIPKIQVLPLGSDISTKDIININDINKSKEELSFLMVGTIEPRKAHMQVIMAFEILWKNKIDISLTIIGKKGWLVEKTITRIQEHPQLNKKLFYYENVDDKELMYNYRKASAIIVASYAEGYGLPLVEAINNKKPIIARDIKTFREIGKNYPLYFKNSKNPLHIVETIKIFIYNYSENKHLRNKNEVLIMSWKKHTKKLIKIIS